MTDLALDILIKNARVVDGTGNPWFPGDVGIAGGLITEVSPRINGRARHVINADGMVASPGFVDIHSHDELSLLSDPLDTPKIVQGVTTVVTGNCGISTFPVAEGKAGLLREHVEQVLSGVEEEDLKPSVNEFARLLARRGTATNVAALVGHGAIRVAVMGYEARRPTEAELEKMKALVASAIGEGAFGLSLGLLYAPGSFAEMDELVALGREAAAGSGILAAHVRTYETYLKESVQEFLEILRRSDAAGQLSHLHAGGKKNWGKVKDVLRMMIDARRGGIDIMCDMYPYTAGSTTLSTLMPPGALASGPARLAALLQDPAARAQIRADVLNGTENRGWESKAPLLGWENIMISSVVNPRYRHYEGKSFAQLAGEQGGNPFDLLADLLIADRGQTLGIMFSNDPEDIKTIYASPLHIVGSDGLWRASGKPHPRLYGAFARVIRHMVREEGVLTLEQAVRKMTSLPAERLGILNRGLLWPGMAADVVLFRPEAVEDRATFAEPRQLATGFSTVIVNGVVAVEDGQPTGKTPGMFLRHQARPRRYVY